MVDPGATWCVRLNTDAPLDMPLDLWITETGTYGPLKWQRTARAAILAKCATCAFALSDQLHHMDHLVLRWPSLHATQWHAVLDTNGASAATGGVVPCQIVRALDAADTWVPVPVALELALPCVKMVRPLALLIAQYGARPPDRCLGCRGQLLTPNDPAARAALVAGDMVLHLLHRATDVLATALALHGDALRQSQDVPVPRRPSRDICWLPILETLGELRALADGKTRADDLLQLFKFAHVRHLLFDKRWTGFLDGLDTAAVRDALQAYDPTKTQPLIVRFRPRDDIATFRLVDKIAVVAA